MHSSECCHYSMCQGLAFLSYLFILWVPNSNPHFCERVPADLYALTYMYINDSMVI